MKVDRTRFLLLTGALSAAAAAGIMGANTGCSTTSDTTDSGTATPDSGGDTGTTDAGGGGSDADAGIACLGDTAPATDGGDGGDGGVDCTANACGVACGDVATNFKAGIAAEANACILKLPTCESITADTDVASCVEKALAKACDDTTAKTICTPLVTDCNGGDAGTDAGATDAGDAGTATFDQASCEALVKGLSADGRATFTSCITEGIPGNCTADTQFCVDNAKR